MKLKIDIFKALLKVLVMPLADISVLDSLLACGCFYAVLPVRVPHVPRLEISLPWDAGVE